MGKELDKVRSKGAVLGINIGAALDELKEDILSAVKDNIPPPVDVDKIINQVSARVLSDVGVRLTEAVDKISSNVKGDINTDSLIQGVAKLLEPKINQAIETASANQFQANYKTLQAEIYKQLDVRIGELVDQIKGAGQNENQPASRGSFLREIISVMGDKDCAEGVKNIISIFRPAPVQTSQDLIIKYFTQGLTSGSKLKAGEMTAEQVATTLKELSNQPS